MNPGEFSRNLKKIAASIQASTKPDAGLVISDLKKLIFASEDVKHIKLPINSKHFKFSEKLSYGEIAEVIKNIEKILKRAGATELEWDQEFLNIFFLEKDVDAIRRAIDDIGRSGGKSLSKSVLESDETF